MIRYRCPDCSADFESRDVIYRCPVCAAAAAGSADSTEKPEGFQRGNLLVVSDLSAATGLKPGDTIDPFALLPQDFPVAECHQAFPAGNTPVVRLTTSGGPTVYGKMDSLNPSGSLKDRASLLVAAQAKYHGESRVVLASTGNAGSAMSCAGAALGLEIILFVPAKAPLEKLAQSVFYGATVIPVDGTYDDAFGLSIEYSKQFGGINRNTAFNPMTVEGKKTAAIEIYNQFAGNIPNVIYVPVGDGVIYTGLVKGFSDLKAAGLIEKLPRCVAVQASGSNAISQSYIQGREIVLDAATTRADSISVASPACGSLAISFLQDSGGWSVEIDDEAILDAQAALAAGNGLFVEPSSAITWAALQADLESGKVSSDDTVLLLLTGSGFKDMSAVTGRISIPEAVPANLDAVAHYLQTRSQADEPNTGL